MLISEVMAFIAAILGIRHSNKMKKNKIEELEKQIEQLKIEINKGA